MRGLCQQYLKPDRKLNHVSLQTESSLLFEASLCGAWSPEPGPLRAQGHIDPVLASQTCRLTLAAGSGQLELLQESCSQEQVTRPGLRKTEKSLVSTYSKICGLLLPRRLGLTCLSMFGSLKEGSMLGHRGVPGSSKPLLQSVNHTGIPLPTWHISFIHCSAYTS